MKNKFLKVCTLSLVFLLVGCDDIVAKPKNANDNLITFSDGSVYFQNNYDKVYSNLQDSSSFNTLTFDALLNKIIDDKLGSVEEGSTTTFFKNKGEDLKKELVEEKLLKILDSDSYKTDKLFSETKFLNTINGSLYKVTVPVANRHEGVIVKPDTEVKDLLGADYATTYKAYIDAEIMPEINKNLLTARYICQKSFSSLGRAYARDISYVKLENIEMKPGAAGQLINKWLKAFLDEGTLTGGTTFDLDSLARIYKGLAGETAAEVSYISETYTLSNEITDEISKVCDVADNYKMKLDIDIDKTIEDKYTNSGVYTLAWGHELAKRELASKKISDSGLFTKTNGISDLPSDITDRLFSSSVNSYTESAYYMADGTNPYKTDAEGKKTHKGDAKEVKFLSPLTSENGSELGKYYFYDSGTNAYYIVVVNDSKYTSSDLSSVENATKGPDGSTIVGVSDKTARVALELASTGTYASDAILDVLKEYKIVDNMHDQNFYDYIKDNYSDLF